LCAEVLEENGSRTRAAGTAYPVTKVAAVDKLPDLVFYGSKNRKNAPLPLSEDARPSDRVFCF
jgi:hypothetical protein